MKKGPFSLRLKFEEEKIVDTNLKDIDEVANIFIDLKRKFK